MSFCGLVATFARNVLVEDNGPETNESVWNTVRESSESNRPSSVYWEIVTIPHWGNGVRDTTFVGQTTADSRACALN